MRDLCAHGLQKVGVAADDAWITSDGPLTADLRGIDSHGVARLALLPGVAAILLTP